MVVYRPRDEEAQRQREKELEEKYKIKTNTFDFVKGIVGGISGDEASLQGIVDGDFKEISRAGKKISVAQFAVGLGVLAGGMVAGGIGSRAGARSAMGVEAGKLKWWQSVPRGGSKNRAGRFERKNYTPKDLVDEIETKRGKKFTPEERRALEGNENIGAKIRDVNARPKYYNAYGSKLLLEDASSKLGSELKRAQDQNNLELANSMGNFDSLSDRFFENLKKINTLKANIADLNSRINEHKTDVEFYKSSENPKTTTTTITKSGTEDPAGETAKGKQKVPTEDPDSTTTKKGKDPKGKDSKVRSTEAEAEAERRQRLIDEAKEIHREIEEAKAEEDAKPDFSDPVEEAEQETERAKQKQKTKDRIKNEEAERDKIIREREPEKVDTENRYQKVPKEEPKTKTITERQGELDPIEFGRETERALEGKKNAKSRVKPKKIKNTISVGIPSGISGSGSGDSGSSSSSSSGVNRRRVFGDAEGEEQGGNFKGTGKIAVKQILDRTNLDELLQETLKLSTDAYNPDIGNHPDSYPNYNFYANDMSGSGKDFNVPFLIYTDINTLYIAFRGTDNIRNVITDLTTSGLGSSKPNMINAYDFPIENDKGMVEVHAGMLEATHEIYNFAKSRIKKIGNIIQKVIVTGHSLGSGVGGIFAYIYANDRDRELPPIDYVVGYGSPRFLFDNEFYREMYMESLPNTIRVWNTRDPIPYLPFKEPIAIDFMGSRIASGYTHVGKSFDLTSNYVNNSANILLYLILKGNKGKIKTLLENEAPLTTNRLLDFMLSPKYQRLTLQGFLQCYSEVEVKPEVTQKDIEFLAEQLKGQTEVLGSYVDKCNLLKPFGLDDMMRLNRISDDVDKTNFSIFTMFATSVGSNKTMSNAHKTSYYKEKLDKIINLQAQQQKFIYEVEDIDHEVFITDSIARDEPELKSKVLGEETESRISQKIKMVQGLIYEDVKNLNGQVIVY